MANAATNVHAWLGPRVFMIHLDRPPTGVPSLPTTVLETLAEYLGAYDLRYPRLPVDVFWEPNGACTGVRGPAGDHLAGSDAGAVVG